MAERAFIFDMDGTIVDNMGFHTDSWLEFFARRGKQYDPDVFFRETAGAQGREILRARLGPDIPDDEIAVLAQEKDALYREMYAPHRAPIEGFEDFVTLADARVSLELITAMYYSAETGSSVSLPIGADHPRYASWLPQA